MVRFAVWALPILVVLVFPVVAPAEDTPPDPVFNGVQWLVCKTDMVKYKEGMAEKESKWECVDDAGKYERPSKVVATGNEKVEIAIQPGIRGSIYYYPVMTTAQAEHFSKSMYELQCDKRLGRLDGGIRGDGVALYMFSPPEMDQGNGNTWAEDQFKAKGQKVLPSASVYGEACRKGSSCTPNEVNCQFYSKSTGKRFGLFHARIP